MILLAVGAAVAWGASDFFGGALRRGLPVFAVLAVTQLIGLLLLIPVLLLHGVPFPHNPRILFAAAAGIGTTLELCLVYLAISRGDSFITAPVAAIGATLAVLTGLIGGEQLSLPVAAGLACALCGGLSSAFSSPERPSSMPAAVGICLGAAVGLAGALVCLHAASRIDPVWAATLLDVGTLVPAVLIFSARSGRARRTLPGLGRLWPLLLPAAAGVGGDLAYGTASRHGALSIVSGVSCLYPLVTIGLGVLLQGRRAHLAEAGGLALAVAGTVLLGASTG
ncbi:MAG TPA: DMT family transporter [Solirubrobacteraceae bacterium]|nr:DMT family transporter [Solirubrobacteraceae bacterium]